MNNNSFPRIIQTALLKVASGNQASCNEIMCVYQEFRGERLSLESPVEIDGQSAVSVEHDDAMYLGEVVRVCETNGRWQIEIKVEQILSGLSSLLALRNSLLCDRTTNPLAAALTESRS